MAKFDSVDRLMKLAMDAKAPAKERGAVGAESEDLLESKVSASERGIPPAVGTAAPGPPQPSASDRGRQLLGAIRPFLPAVGGALRLVDHGAVQTVARLLPLLGSFGSSGSASPAATEGITRGTTGAAQGGGEPGSLHGPLAGLNQRQAIAEEEFKTLQGRFLQHEEQSRRIRESQERLSAEQGSLSHLVHQLQDRTRLLTAGIVILLMLVIAQAVLTVMFLHR